MTDTSAKLEKFFNKLEDMKISKSLKNEAGRIARQEGVDAAIELIDISLEVEFVTETGGLEEAVKPKKKPPVPEPKMLGGRIYASRKPKSL